MHVLRGLEYSSVLVIRGLEGIEGMLAAYGRYSPGEGMWLGDY
jgi:hypothetical protein